MIEILAAIGVLTLFALLVLAWPFGECLSDLRRGRK